MPTLVLTDVAVPRLLRRGSPVYESGESGIKGWRGVVVPSLRGTYLVVRWENEPRGMETTITGGTALGLEDPLGVCTALLYAKDGGYDLSWAVKEADVLIWSVLSIARGGKPIVDVVRQRCWGSAGCLKGVTRYYLERETTKAHVFYADVSRGKDDRPAAIAEALAANYAVRSETGSILLPPLPELTP